MCGFLVHDNAAACLPYWKKVIISLSIKTMPTSLRGGTVGKETLHSEPAKRILNDQNKLKSVSTGKAPLKGIEYTGKR